MTPAVTPVLIGLAVAVAVAVRPVWRWLRNFVTFVHEAGHAVVALACGAKVQKIRLRFDTSGDTSWSFKGNPGGLRRFAVAAGGYPAAPLAGLAVAWSVASDHAEGAVIAVAAGWAIVSVVWVRNGWGLVCALAGALVGGAAWYAGYAPVALEVVGWLWLLGGLRASWEVTQGGHRRGDASDPGQMGGVTHLPAGLWAWVFVLLAAGAAVAGGRFLLADVTLPDLGL
jgi:hypothetical protein